MSSWLVAHQLVIHQLRADPLSPFFSFFSFFLFHSPRYLYFDPGGASARVCGRYVAADWTSEEREYLRTAVTKDGLQTPFRDGTVQDIAKDMVRIAKEGLTRRKCNEENFVDGLMVRRDGLTDGRVAWCSV